MALVEQVKKGGPVNNWNHDQELPRRIVKFSGLFCGIKLAGAICFFSINILQKY